MSIFNEIVSIVSTAVSAARRGAEIRKENLERDIAEVLKKIEDGASVFDELERRMQENKDLEASYRARFKSRHDTYRSPAPPPKMNSASYPGDTDTLRRKIENVSSGLDSIKTDMVSNQIKLNQILGELRVLKEKK